MVTKWNGMLDAALCHSLENTGTSIYHAPRVVEVGTQDCRGCIVSATTEESRLMLSAAGMELIKRGRVALAIMMGGQGSRLLGKVKPLAKVTQQTNKSLLQLMFEKIRALFESARVLEHHAYIYLLTSTFTKSFITRELDSHQYFGLNPHRLVILTQDNLPCLTIDERKLLVYDREVPGVTQLVNGKFIATAPNGNGALFEALARNSTFLEQLEQLEWLHIVSIDNCLCRPFDAEFLGLTCHVQDAQALCKCIQARPGESLGIFTMRGDSRGCSPLEDSKGATLSQTDHDTKINLDSSVKLDTHRIEIVEYSELYKLANFTQGHQNVQLWGNICDHLLSGPLLSTIIEQQLYKRLEYHVAKKRVPILSENGVTFPTEPNCYKLELFVFDILKFAKGTVCYKVIREEAFLPVKNAADLDGGPNSVQAKLGIA
ncbi:bifunctional Nucleotide-diphospho-sugar transferases/UDPGP family/UDP-sugar pyrophosphorylase [Babesia duncani]|uniref:UDP-N-acetylglucosamine diphosphorylase n=1 Tax=Babesia duncani TaxID=323732 RepID=A0AAD9PMT4_9APIC|nr:bifunctional Nucleotide-diphospho-sugar transferases/UDPGP family/UDP-sugar pyrophosphorylase [Babesia duncani]